jgi:hypothetical protein
MATMYAIYKGRGTTGLFSAWFNGTRWGGDDPIKVRPNFEWRSIASYHSPTVCRYMDRLYLVLRPDDVNVISTSVFDAVNGIWEPHVPIDQQPGGVSAASDCAPAVVVFQEMMFVIYKAIGKNSLRTAYFDGMTWHGGQLIADQPGGLNPQCGDAPGVATYSGLLYVAFKTATQNATDRGDLNLIAFDGESWSVPQTEYTGKLPFQSTESPTLVVYRGELYIFWVSPTARMILWTVFGRFLAPAVPARDAKSDRRPGACVFFGNLFLLYKGWNSDALWISQYDGTGWSESEPLADQRGTLHNPMSDRTPHMYVDVAVRSHADWMKGVDSDLSIGAIDVPGTHDSAAINHSQHTPYAVHDNSITDQLVGGIRALDVRIKVKKKTLGIYDFVTCHGHIGSTTGTNEYQSLTSLFGECAAFLRSHGTEAIFMMLKVDDWANVPVQEQGNALNDLKLLLTPYPTITSLDLPRLGTARGHIVLFSRINDDPRFGAGLDWTRNTPGQLVPAKSGLRNFEFYVQDKFEDLKLLSHQSEKLTLFQITAAQPEPLILNYASATRGKLWGVDIRARILNWIGQATPRPPRLGWCFFDYALAPYLSDKYDAMTCVDIVVDSNNRGGGRYHDYPDRFVVTE